MRSDDIVTLLLEDHAQAREQLDAFSRAEQASLQQLFSKLADSLTRHEVAEEMVLYPVLRMEPGGNAIADARAAEQSETVGMLAEMEQMTIESAEFAEAFETLRSAVREHTYAEEEFVFPMLQEEEQQALLVEMGRRYAAVRGTGSENAALGVAQLAQAIRESAPELTRKSVTADVPSINDSADAVTKDAPKERIG